MNIKNSTSSFDKYMKAETGYKLWLNYDNDKEMHCIPVLPEKIKVTVKGQTSSVNLNNFGEVLYKAKREAKVISFSSFFPAQYESYCSCFEKDFETASAWNSWLEYLLEAEKPAHIVLTNSPLGVNFYGDITSYVPSEEGGDPGTIQYTLEIKEHRTPTVRTYKKSIKKTSKAKISKKKKRISNVVKPKTYTVKFGDCLWNIAKKFYGDGEKCKKIYTANKSAIEKAAKKHGFSSSNGGKRIWAGLKLKLP